MSAGRRRRVLLIEVDIPGDEWSSAALEAELVAVVPNLRPVVFGEIDGNEIDAAYRKLRQLSVETDSDQPLADRVHSAHKAMTLFRQMFPGRFWDWCAIGLPMGERRRLLDDVR